ncbi:MAG: SMP-30/gluconolactonase/LRE family protein, partial [Muribaculaceae bacterium]|nr:SMP-30/gluconolactonase/LRE family protein [Muribaculaceae bacterium]
MTRIRLFISVMAALLCCVAGYAARLGNATDQAVPETSGVPSARYFFPDDQPAYRLGVMDSPSPEMVVEAAPARTVTASGATICGIINSGGKYSISSTTVAQNAAIETVNALESQLNYHGAVYVNGRYYVLWDLMNVAYACDIYDVSSGWMKSSGPMMSGSVYPVSMTYNPIDNKVYGIFNANAAGTVYEFGTFDIETGKKTVIASLPGRFVAVAADNAGTLYSISGDGSLYRIDTASGAQEKIGDTGVTPGSGKQDACFDPESGEMYWIVSNAIYVVDPQSGHADKVSDIAGSSATWMGTFVKSENNAVIPTWVDNMVLDYAKDALSGYVRFKMPTRSTSGEELEGQLQYQIDIDNDRVTGDAAPGE